MMSQGLSQKANTNYRPSFKSIINIEGQKVMVKSKNYSQAKESNIINVEHLQQTNNTENSQSNKPKKKKVKKVESAKNCQMEGNLVKGFMSIQKKVGKLQEKINDYQKKLYKLSSSERNKGKQNEETFDKYRGSEEQEKKLKNIQQFLSEYMEEVKKQTKQIEEGYLNKLSEIDEQSNQPFQQIVKLKCVKQFVQHHQMSELEKRINHLQLVLR